MSADPLGRLPRCAAHPLGRLGLAPVAWLDECRILATLSVSQAGTTSSPVVLVDPATGTLRTLVNRSFDVVGLA